MSTPVPHRKRVRHYDEPGHAHALTFSCYQRLPLLTGRPAWCRLLSRSIDRATERLGFAVVAFVYMPEHVHLLVWPRVVTARVADLLYAVKKPFSFRVKQDLLAAGDPLLARLTVRERPGKTAFRFWQEGGGFDRNLTDRAAIWAEAEYYHENPVKRALCATAAEWKWSSWRHYHRPDLPPDPDLPRIDGFPD